MSRAAINKKLNELIVAGLGCRDFDEYWGWSRRVAGFLSQAFDPPIADEFTDVDGERSSWHVTVGRQVGMLEGLMAFHDDASAQVDLPAAPSTTGALARPSKRVFVVHGHDDGPKEAVARYLERLGLEAIVLHEKPNEGLTIIDKFERHSDVAFAVVLLTPDDIGAAKADAASLKPRARQNVVFELGYFAGKLTRGRVCALYKGGVDIPSDLQGVLYIELDTKGAWRMKLAQELMNVRLPIKLEGVLNS